MPIAKKKYDAATIQDASTTEIIQFALEEAGLAFDKGVSREYMLQQVFEALQWLQKDPTEGATHVLLKIAHSGEQGGQRDVRLGHNGRMMTIKREVEVEVPIEFYNVLMDINSLGYTIPPLDKLGVLRDEASLTKRVQNTLFPVTVLRFINKGKK